MATRPNILVVMVDDMGFSDIGCYGGEIRTPNLDRLAEGGVRFTNFYNCARCCPTRASLLTGLYPHQAGIGHMTSENENTRAFNRIIDDDGYQGRLNQSCVTIPEVLRTSGYATYMSGKWHVGTDRPHWPVDRGFDRYYGIIRGASNHFRPEDEKLLLSGVDRVAPGPGFYSSEAFSSNAARFIREHDSGSPFFLYLAYTAPHWPLHAWPEDIERYRGNYMKGWDALREERLQRQKEIGLFDRSVGLSPRDEESPPWEGIDNRDEWDLRMAVYAAMVDRVDRGMGQVISALKDTGAFENTLILFLSDNGACAESYNNNPDVPPGPVESDTGVWLPWANASNTPFKLFKHFTHEGGINTPLIAHWPAGLAGRAGTIQRTYAAHVKDIMATCLDISGAEYPETFVRREVEHRITPLEGHSFLGALRGEQENNENTIFWEHEGNRAVREGPWKLTSWYGEAHGFATQWGVGKGCRTGRWQLFNLADDPTELNNLVESEAERARAMMADYEVYAERTGVKEWQEIQEAAGNCTGA